MEHVETTTQPFTVHYRDGWGDRAIDRFATHREAEVRLAYLLERGRAARIGAAIE